MNDTPPNVRRRGPGRNRPGATDPIREAMGEDTQRAADSLRDALETLSSMTADTGVKVMLNKVLPSGKWEFIKTLLPPIDHDEIVEELKDEYGAGDYAFRVMANSQIKTTKYFSIARPKGNQISSNERSTNNTDMTRLLLDMSDKSRSEQGNMFQLMMTMMQQSSQQMMQSQQQSTQLMVTLMTAMMGNKQDPMDSIAKIMGLVKEGQGPQASMKEQLETLTMLKDLTTVEKATSEDEGGIMGLAKTFLPGIADMASMAMKGMGQGGAQGDPGQAMPQLAHQPAPPAERGMPPTVPNTGQLAAPQPAAFALAEGIAPHPVLSIIREDVAYFMRRQHDPELTADALGDILDAHNVGQEQLFALVMEFQAAGEQWPARLAEQGIDISANPVWFDQVVQSLIARYSDGDDQAGDRGGPAGGGTDARPDAAASAERIAAE